MEENPCSDLELAYHADRLRLFCEHNEDHKNYSKDNNLGSRLSLWRRYLYTTVVDINISEEALLNFSCVWNSYAKYDYVKTAEFLEKIVPELESRNTWYNAALAFSKLYTRIGQWEAAREWCLYYLGAARKQAKTFNLAKGYGALAEIFLRAGFPQEALACFQISFRLMPMESGQRAKQYGYLASALMRNEEWFHAESLLNTSIQIDKNESSLSGEASNDGVYSAMRLAFCQLFYQRKISRRELEKHIDKKGLKALPRGLLSVAFGLDAWDHQKSQEAQAYFQKAVAVFNVSLALEKVWAQKLLNSVSEEQVEVDDHLKNFFKIKVHQAPRFDCVVDKTWRIPKLMNNGFEPLLTAQNIAELKQLWKIFFI